MLILFVWTNSDAILFLIGKYCDVLTRVPRVQLTEYTRTSLLITDQNVIAQLVPSNMSIRPTDSQQVAPICLTLLKQLQDDHDCDKQLVALLCTSCM